MDHNHLLEYHESENLLFYTVFISPGEPNESGLFSAIERLQMHVAK